MKRFFKKKWLIIGGVLALVLLIVGITIPVMAASGKSNTSSSSSSSSGPSYFDGPTMSRIAAALGMTATDLNTQLQAGTTLAELAQEHNVTTDTIENAMVAPYADLLANQVKYGYMTQDQANTALTNAKNQAGSLMQQDLSGKTASNGQSDDDNGWGPGDCWDYMTSNGYGPGYGREGMGPGMMYGWGYNNNGSQSAPGPNASPNSSSSDSSYNTPRGYGGYGMMGGR